MSGSPALAGNLGGRVEHNLLIVDDISDNIQVLGHVLAKEDYLVSFATDGRQALEMIAENDFDLILLDTKMALAEGVKTARVIRRLEEYSGRHARIVGILDDGGDPEIEVRYRESGVDDFVRRPLSHEVLVQLTG